jgi:hypothetical protein
MSQEQSNSTISAGAWDLRHPGLVMKGANGEEIHEFTGMWPLKPDADLVDMENTLSREAPFWGGPGKTFSEATTQLGLIRTARWFVATSTEFGPTLYFITQFDSSLEKYFDDFVLNGKRNLLKAGAIALAVPTARTRQRATSSSTSHAGRSRPWSVTTRFRAST